jgi:hypothetical protein
MLGSGGARRGGARLRVRILAQLGAREHRAISLLT